MFFPCRLGPRQNLSLQYFVKLYGSDPHGSGLAPLRRRISYCEGMPNYQGLEIPNYCPTGFLILDKSLIRNP
jgi:hypothetical protein